MTDNEENSVVFKIHADSSGLDSELKETKRKIKKSAEETEKTVKKSEQNTAKTVKQGNKEKVYDTEQSEKKRRKAVSETVKTVVKSEGEAADTVKKNNDNIKRHAADTGEKIVKNHKSNAEKMKKDVSDYEEKAKASASNVGKAYLAAGAAAVAASVSAVTEAAKAETSFAKVKTLLSDKAITDDYYNSLKAASKETGVMFGDLSESVYSAISASVDENSAVDFSKTAVKLAKGGFTEAATAVDVLTTAINAYNLAADDASHISDVLVIAQNEGKTTVGELAGSMGQTIPIANSAGAAIEDLAAQYAVLTKNGIATSEAGTGIKAMLSELNASGTTVSKTLKGITGKSFSELQTEGKSTADVLMILKDYAESSGKKLSDLFGSVEAGSASLTLVKDNGRDFSRILGKMENSAGAAQKAYETMSDTLEERFVKLKNKAVIAFTEVGEMLMPYAEKLVSYLEDNSEEIAETITDVGTAAGELAKLLGGLLKIVWENKEAVISAAAAFAAFKTAAAVSSVVNSAAKAVSALNVALNANPYAVAAAGIALVATSLLAISNKAKEAEERIESYNEAVADINKSFDNTISAAEREMSALDKKIRRYDELRNITERTVEEESELRDIANDLQEIFGSSVSVVNSLTGEYEDLTVAAQNYSSQQLALVKLEASKDKLTELYKLKEKTENEYDAAYSAKSRDVPVQTGFSLIDDMLWEGYNKGLAEISDEYTSRIEDIDSRIASVEADITQKSTDYYNTVADSTYVFNENSSAVNNKASAIKSQKTAYDELTESVNKIISDYQGLYDILDKVKNGEALNYSEIQQLIALYPDLADKISLTKDGYVIEKNALDDLNAALGNSIQTQLDAEREKTEAAIDGAEERIRIYQKEAEAIAKLGKDSDRKRLAEIGRSIGEEAEYITGLKAKLKTDEKVSDYMKNTASVKSGGGSASVSEENGEYEKKRDDLDYSRRMGYISDSEYYRSLGELRDKYLTPDSAEWRSANVSIHNYEESLKNKSADSEKHSSASGKPSSGLISITSYIPTIWDDEETANSKLARAVGIERAGNSGTGKIISGTEGAAQPDTVSPQAVKTSSAEATLSDVVTAVKGLEKSYEKLKISLDVELKARDMSIGRVAVEDINDMAKVSGKSPFNF